MSSVADSLLASIPVDETALLAFLKRYRARTKSVYLLVEGKDDFLYYRNCSAVPFAGWELVPVIAGNKKGVLYVYEQIQTRSDIEKNRVLFFIDRDFDDFLVCPPKYDPAIYITDGYSIENTACGLSCCSTFISRHSTSKYCLSDEELAQVSALVSEALNCFISLFATLTALLIVCRRNKINVNYKNINIKSYFSFSNGAVAVKRNGQSPLPRFLNDCGVSEDTITPYSCELRRIEQELKSCSLDRSILIVRGKYLYSYISSFLRSLSGYSISESTKIKIPNSDLDELLFASCPPDSLCKYINEHAARLSQ